MPRRKRPKNRIFINFTESGVEEHFENERDYSQNDPPPYFYHRFRGAIKCKDFSAEKVADLIKKTVAELNTEGIDIPEALSLFTYAMTLENCNRSYHLEGKAGFLYIQTWNKNDYAVEVYIRYFKKRKIRSWEDVPEEECCFDIIRIR